MSDQYNLTTTAPAARRVDPSVKRYDPWLLGLYVTAALLLPFVAGGLGYFVWGWIGVLLGIAALPITGFVLMWVFDAWLVEHQRLKAERQSFVPAAVSSAGETPVPVGPAARPEHLRLGVKVNGEWQSPADQMHPELMALRAKCLRLVRAGLPAENWSRSALAEGGGAVMSGPDWDEASGELQHQDLFVVKPGKGGGLKPNPARDLAESIRRLEVAR